MRYPKECVLKDCQQAVIRPLVIGDEARLAQFYEKNPDADRWYMRYDATHPDVLRKWFKGIASYTNPIALGSHNTTFGK